MNNPFHKKMPLRLDIKIRLRLLLERLKDMKQTLSFVGGLLTVPAIAMLFFLVQVNNPEQGIDPELLVADIMTAQASELEYGSKGIYHVKRMIVEGEDKPAFVESVLGVNAEVEKRVDVVETWQHNDTALALVESNSTSYEFEAFLSREHDGELLLHHYGEKEKSVDTSRKPYDEAHDLASLYTSYMSLERPTIPVLPEDAEFVDADTEKGLARFTFAPAEGLEVEYHVDLETKLVVEEIIYVFTDNGKQYEMTRVVYLERSVESAEDFDTIFDTNRFTYNTVS